MRDNMDLDLVSERSFERIGVGNLRRVAGLPYSDLNELFNRRPETRSFYADRLLALCLCQGVAEHFVRPGRGIKDFDLWAFFAENLKRPFSCRRRGKVDFGCSKYGRHREGHSFKGRRIDIIGRSFPVGKEDNNFEDIRYETQSNT